MSKNMSIGKAYKYRHNNIVVQWRVNRRTSMVMQWMHGCVSEVSQEVIRSIQANNLSSYQILSDILESR